jgi:peptide/nickel transport system substrate-binding protein
MIRTRLGVLLAGAALVATACSGSSTPSPSAAASSGPSASAGASASAAASPSAAIKEGGTLVYGLPGDMTEADPSLVSDSNSSEVQLNVVEGLVGLKPGTTSDVIPVLASALPTVSSDGLTWTFKLRTGVKFHDGTPFNADAVVYNYTRQKNAPKELQDAYNYYFGAVFGFGPDSNLKSITAPDEQTVVMTLGQPQSNFLLAQVLPQFGIQSPAALKAGDADNPDPSKSPYAQGKGGTGKSMVGTGPFMFKEWVPGDHVTIVKNPDYWDQTNAAHLDTVIFRPFKDKTSELNALQAGDIDIAQDIGPTDVKTVQSDPNLKIIDRGSSCNLLPLEMNNVVKPFDNLKIRQAVGYAVNKQGYADTFYGGLAAPANNWMPPGTAYFKDETLPTYDPQKAKDLIAQSGVTGSGLDITLWYPADVTRPYMPDPKGIAEAIANDLEAVGFNVTFKSEPWAQYVPDANSGKLSMYLLGWTCDWAGPDNFLVAAFFAFQSNGQPNKQFGYGPPDLKAAFDAGLTATSDSAAATAWGQAQDILARDLPTIPLINSKVPAAAKADVMGYPGAGNLEEPLNVVWLNR